MSDVAGRVGRFLLIFLIALATLVPLWGVVAPTYTAAVSALARPGFYVVESQRVTVLVAQHDELWAYRRVGDREISPFTFYDRYAFFAVLPLVALIIATPGLRWSRRLVALLAAIAAQLVAHAAFVVASIELAYVGTGLTVVSPAAAGALGAVQVLVRFLWEASPLAIWIALTVGAWKKLWRSLRHRGASPATVRTGRARAATKEHGVQLREGRTT